MRPNIIKDTHDSLGHVGITKTWEAVALNYWWPGLRQDVTKILLHCQIC